MEKRITYKDFEEAVDTLGLIGLETTDKVKKRYLKLSKKYHPDMPKGSTEKFQELTFAYKIVTYYMENFRFRFTKEEFQNQYPFSIYEDVDWLSR
jgi:preprotein translocase subunit Sec63